MCCALLKRRILFIEKYLKKNKIYFINAGLGVVQASTSQINIESPILITCILLSVKNIFRIGSE